MIQVSPLDDGGVSVTATLIRQPAIYLDQFALDAFARQQARRDRFLKIWQTKGELLFSYVNALDLSGPQNNTASIIRDFLEGLGPYWIPLELNPWKIVRKENGQEPASGTACVSESFLNGYFLELRDEATNLGKAVDLIQAHRATSQAQVQQLKDDTNARVQDYRNAFKKDAGSLDKRLPSEAYDPQRPATFVLRQMERLITKQAKSHTWMPNDGIDFLHATVAAGCADFLVLDKHWKARVEEIAPKKSYKWVYYGNELDEFLDVFEHCVIGSAP